jgi:hypothetical protein
MITHAFVGFLINYLRGSKIVSGGGRRSIYKCPNKQYPGTVVMSRQHMPEYVLEQMQAHVP